jgi:hypothetical protein
VNEGVSERVNEGVNEGLIAGVSEGLGCELVKAEEEEADAVEGGTEDWEVGGGSRGPRGGVRARFCNSQLVWMFRLLRVMKKDCQRHSGSALVHWRVGSCGSTPR